jgi:hypothetical protein
MYERIREKVPFIEEDTIMSGYLEEVRKMVVSG